MAYHESFWVAVAAAAPVIALANTVLVTDVAGVWLNVKSPPRPARYRLLFSGIILLSAINMFDQGLALLLALRSLYTERNAAPPSTETNILGYGLLVVFVTTVASVFLRFQLHSYEKRQEKLIGEEDDSARRRPRAGRPRGPGTLVPGAAAGDTEAEGLAYVG